MMKWRLVGARARRMQADFDVFAEMYFSVAAGSIAWIRSQSARYCLTVLSFSGSWYKITYPTGKIYIGKDSVGNHRYFGSPDMDFVNNDFENLPDEIRKDYTIRKQILWESEDCSESELSKKEVEFIRIHRANDPAVGYNQWPKFKE